MYIRQVIAHSRWLAVVIMLFMVMQLLVNYKRGVVITPFYHYGMYSHVMTPDSVYPVFEVQVNGSLLKGSDFSATEWDRILMPLQYFTGLKANQQFYRADVSRILKRLHLPAPEEIYVQHCDYKAFKTWYSQYLSTITHQPVIQLHIAIRAYQFAQGKLLPGRAVTDLSLLCS